MPGKSAGKKFIRDNQLGARRELLEELFNDLYNDRHNIYLMNFIRGISFGAGSIIGGTLVVVLTVTVLSQFVDWFPVLGGFVNGIIDAMHHPR